MAGHQTSNDRPLKGKRVAFLATDGFEQVELTRPWEAISNAGAIVELISPKQGMIQGMNYDQKADQFEVDFPVTHANPDRYDALVLPGGVVNPDSLRTNTVCVQFVREFFKSAKPVAAICHAPWMLVEAGVVDGRRVTSWLSIKTDLENAGATWENSPVVVDNGLVTSRSPDDLDAFCAKAIEEIAEGTHVGQTV